MAVASPRPPLAMTASALSFWRRPPTPLPLRPASGATRVSSRMTRLGRGWRRAGPWEGTVCCGCRQLPVSGERASRPCRGRGRDRRAAAAVGGAAAGPLPPACSCCLLLRVPGRLPPPRHLVGVKVEGAGGRAAAAAALLPKPPSARTGQSWWLGLVGLANRRDFTCPAPARRERCEGEGGSDDAVGGRTWMKGIPSPARREAG